MLAMSAEHLLRNLALAPRAEDRISTCIARWRLIPRLGSEALKKLLALIDKASLSNITIDTWAKAFQMSCKGDCRA